MKTRIALVIVTLSALLPLGCDSTPATTPAPTNSAPPTTPPPGALGAGNKPKAMDPSYVAPAPK
jgi:hypothetical protein